MDSRLHWKVKDVDMESLRSTCMSGLCLGILTLSPATLGTVCTDRPLMAPTYYVAARIRGCTSSHIEIRGATNLPAGAVISFQVASMKDNGWQDIGDKSTATVDDRGWFSGALHATGRNVFRPNLFVRIYFSPAYDKQPPNVIAVVGQRGQHLADSENPQMGTLSGEYVYLESIARIASCGSM